MRCLSRLLLRGGRWWWWTHHGIIMVVDCLIVYYRRRGWTILGLTVSIVSIRLITISGSLSCRSTSVLLVRSIVEFSIIVAFKVIFNHSWSFRCTIRIDIILSFISPSFSSIRIKVFCHQSYLFQFGVDLINAKMIIVKWKLYLKIK